MLKKKKFRLVKPFSHRVVATGYHCLTDYQTKRRRVKRRVKLLVCPLMLLVFYCGIEFFYITETFEFFYPYELHKWW